MAELYNLHCFQSYAEHLEFIDSLLADKNYLFPVAGHMEGGILRPNPTQSRKLLTNEQHPLYFLAEAIPRFIYVKFYHRANNCGKSADGFYNSMINDKDIYIPSPLIMFTCTILHYALLVWQKNKVVHLEVSKSKLRADRPDHSNYFNYNNDNGKHASCCTAMGRKLLTSPGIADAYIFLINT